MVVELSEFNGLVFQSLPLWIEEPVVEVNKREPNQVITK